VLICILIPWAWIPITKIGMDVRASCFRKMMPFILA
jgi:hypothetical protein